MKLYVGNLASTISNTELESLFAEHGLVSSVNVIRDQHSGQPRGFGFVEMADVEAKREWSC